MKNITIVYLCFLWNSSSATNFYFSNTGNDASAGTIGAPWQTITKFNSVFASKAPGDSFLFKKGDVFVGTLTPSRAGTVIAPIIIGAYGTGAKPIITGLSQATGWTLISGHTWETNAAVSTLSTCNMVIINGVEVQIGRFPNTGWITYQSFSSNVSITASTVNSSIVNWTDAELVIKTFHYKIKRNTVTSHVGTVLNYSGGGDNGQNNWGFFIQNDARTLDTLNEWYYNPTTKKLRVVSTLSPTDVKLSTVKTLVSMSGSRSFITFDNLDFEGADSNIVQMASDSNVVIKNCTIKFAGADAINTNACDNFTVINSYIGYSNNNATYEIGFESPVNTFKGKNAIFRDDTIHVAGVGRGMLSKGTRNGDAIRIEGTNAVISHNKIDSVGFTAITYDGNNTRVDSNVINFHTLILDDVGGIYTWNGGGTRHNYTGRKARYNIILNSKGAPDGNDGQNIGCGLYVDDLGNNTQFLFNSIANCGGKSVFFHNANTIQLYGNNFYNAPIGIAFQQDIDSSIKLDTIYKNVVFSKSSTQQNWFYNQFNTTTWTPFQFGISDSNFYVRPADNNLLFRVQTHVPAVITNNTLSGWKTASANDAHSLGTPIVDTDTTHYKFIYNDKDVDSTIILGFKYINSQGDTMNGSELLHPFHSDILIKIGASTLLPPTVSAGSDQAITLPTNSTTVTGSATSNNAGGSITTYLWQQTSLLPHIATITCPSCATTSITGMTNANYRFTVTATDNFGAAASDTMALVVNDSTVLPPVANAGVDQSIAITSATLDGSASSDPDGTIVSYTWTKVSGPGATTITHPSDIMPVVSGLQTGVYVFNLHVVNNGGASNDDTVQITVILPPADSKLIIIHGNVKFSK